MANFFIRLINYVLSAIGAALTWVVDLFPESPFADPASPPGSIDLGFVTWLIPFPTMILHLGLLLTAIGTYYLIRVAARWVKIARD